MKTIFSLTIFFLTCGFFSCCRNAISNERISGNSNFSISISAYNHAEQIFNGKTTYKLTANTLTILKSFLYSDKDSILFTRKLDLNAIERIKKIRLDSLDSRYYNTCVMATSGDEYLISATMDSVNMEISLHHYYHEQIEKLINELNKNIPDSIKLDYLKKNTKQDCKM
ncbi:MAG: hypothetical protein RLZZ504_380 [Bacteroidota bacterium]